MKWFILALKRTFTYKGRARRAEIGWFNLTAILLNISLFVISMLIVGLGDIFQSKMIQTIAGGIYGVGTIILSIVTTFTQFSLSARRLHDLGLSGWWQLMVYLGLPTLTFIPIALGAPDFVGMSIMCLVVLLYFVYLGVLFFKDGQRFDNLYGEDPKAIKVDVPEAPVQPKTEPQNEEKETPKKFTNEKGVTVTFSHIDKP